MLARKLPGYLNFLKYFDLEIFPLSAAMLYRNLNLLLFVFLAARCFTADFVQDIILEYTIFYTNQR